MWRAAFFTEKQLETYYSAIHNRQKVQLRGFVSASLNRDFALSWILNPPTSEEGLLLVLFEITVLGSNNHIFMNGGDYSIYAMEEEVLLGDGLRCRVQNIKQIKENLGEFCETKSPSETVAGSEIPE